MSQLHFFKANANLDIDDLELLSTQLETALSKKGRVFDRVICTNYLDYQGSIKVPEPETVLENVSRLLLSELRNMHDLGYLRKVTQSFVDVMNQFEDCLKRNFPSDNTK